MACLRRVCGGKEAWNCRRGRWNGIPRGWGMRGAWEGAGNAWPRRASVYPRDSGEMSRRDARLRSPDRPQPPERQLRTFPGRRHVHAAPELCTRARRREADGSPHRAEDDYVDAGSGDFDLTRRELFAWRGPSISTLRGYLRCPQAATRVYINWHFAPAARATEMLTANKRRRALISRIFMHVDALSCVRYLRVQLDKHFLGMRFHLAP